METALEIVKQHLLSTVGTRMRTEGHEWRMNNPTRPGADSMGFRFNVDTGVWHDHASGESGNAITLARALGLQLPERKPVENSKRAYNGLEDYAKQKGVPVEVFIKAGWSEKPINYQGRPALEFPTRSGKRYRFLDIPSKDNPAFKSEFGYQRCWYGLDKAIAMAKSINAPALVIANGEPSVLVAQYFGIPAFALTSGEGNSVPNDLILELQSKWQGDLIVALDCDNTGRKGAEMYRRTLTSAGFRFRIVDLGLEDKGDVADLCKLYTNDSLDALLKCADMGTKPPAEVAKPTQDLESALRDLAIARKSESAGDLNKLLDRVQVEVDALRGIKTSDLIKHISAIADEYDAWLYIAIANGGHVPGLSTGIARLDEYIGGALPFGSVTVVLAATSQGKSTLVASIGSMLINQAPGLIVGTETLGRSLLNRIVAYRMGLSTAQLRQGQVSPTQLKSIRIISKFLREENIEFLEATNPTPKQIQQAAERAIQQHGCQWAIIDCLSNIGSDGGDNGIFEKASGAADVALELARMNIAVLATSQVGRTPKERGKGSKMPAIHDAKGSGRVEENADMVLSLYNHDLYVRRGEEEPDGNYPPGTILLRMLKNRDGEIPGHGINLMFKGGIGIYDLNGSVEI